MKIHKPKTTQPYFNNVLNDVKKFESRKDDRGFGRGDFKKKFYIHRLVASAFISIYDGPQLAIKYKVSNSRISAIINRKIYINF